MKLAYLLYALLLLSGLFSCVANEKTEMPVIPVDLENSRKKVSLSDITEEVKNIHLELTEHSLISEIVRIRLPLCLTAMENFFVR